MFSHIQIPTTSTQKVSFFLGVSVNVYINKSKKNTHRPKTNIKKLTFENVELVDFLWLFLDYDSVKRSTFLLIAICMSA